MNIIGIHDGHVAGACLFKNGRLTDCISEERLNRIKAFGGFPGLAIACILKQNNLGYKDIDHFVFPTLASQVTTQDISSTTPLRLLRLAAGSGLFPASFMRTGLAQNLYGKIGAFNRRARIFKHFAREHRIDPARITFYDHHLCHVATAEFFAGLDPALIFTLDGAGDGLSGTVTKIEKGKFQRLCAIPAIDTLGGFYSGVTEYLGMKRLEHEYKVMGMAPYGEGAQGLEVLEIFKGYLGLSPDGLGFRNKSGLWGQALTRRMQKDLYKKRFDHISWAAQALLEELVLAWVHNWVVKLQVRDAVFSGGVFMNVKVNQLLNESPKLDNIFFTPACGDSSNVIGACVLKHAELSLGLDPARPRLLYLGPSYDSAEIEDCLNTYQDSVSWVKVRDVEASCAQLLAQDLIIGRLAGRMEFGERALGNRSILCNPQNLHNIRKINQAIKMRDFWMPFAPSVLAEDACGYLSGTRPQDAIYMMTAYNSTESAQNDLPAGLHPFDRTCRPHVVHQAHNPAYHKLLTEFKKLTGVGALLNTSFNIHGEPIVCSPRDAVETLLRSQLDYVVIEDFVVSKKQK